MSDIWKRAEHDAALSAFAHGTELRDRYHYYDRLREMEAGHGPWVLVAAAMGASSHLHHVMCDPGTAAPVHIFNAFEMNAALAKRFVEVTT